MILGMGIEKIIVLAVGGTFDKVYYDDLSDYRVGAPEASRILQQARVGFDYEVEALIGKDSLDMTDEDRRRLRERIEAGENRRFVITHGTDTMVDTARVLGTPTDRTVVLTGAMQPARFRETDADFNLGFALAAAQLLPPGTYIAMQGWVFKPDEVVKDRKAGRFRTAT